MHRRSEAVGAAARARRTEKVLDDLISEIHRNAAYSHPVPAGFPLPKRDAELVDEPKEPSSREQPRSPTPDDSR